MLLPLPMTILGQWKEPQTKGPYQMKSGKALLFGVVFKTCYLLEPVLIMAHLKPMVALEESCVINRLVPGDNQ
jgi:hypothetical protein